MARKIQTNSLTKDKFLQEYNLHEQFAKSEYKWTDLMKIVSDYSSRKNRFDEISKDFTNKIMSFEAVHSVRSRVKDVEHLIEKIIRKKVEDNKDISVDNYLTEITDIVGIRALHVFKKDYLILHNKILTEYKNLLCENIHIKLRSGDDKSIYEEIIKKDDPKIEENEVYRSIHYVINYNNEVRVEIQTRTIFEEGWSEANHKTIYKKNTNNDLLIFSSSILSSLAGNCDSIAELMRKVDNKIENNKSLNNDDLTIISNKSVVDVLEKFIKDF